MNTDLATGVNLAWAIAAGVDGLGDVGVVVCPPFISLAAVREAISNRPVSIGAQNMHHDDSGAFTGEVSPVMLAGVCDYVLLGHSERRQMFGETDEMVGRKVAAAVAHGLRPIVCVGETLEQREAGNATEIVRWQVTSALAEIDAGSANELVIAYEPVWAIGTGRAATPQIADQMMGGAIRSTAAATMPLLYGGSVNAGNAREYASVANINGALVGGASLDADSFLAIARLFGDGKDR
ncbi:Triosephosphate isomerase [Geodia barretti]|uniref:Triosephosphate isomerase n=1 Tax=Geodia barretti TaxID=519541 RepID=A0AA35TJM8_GEOBA|nr:Triosephosphate isomerase [Geodia barretti]